jgi:hypothetical protein
MEHFFEKGFFLKLLHFLFSIFFSIFVCVMGSAHTGGWSALLRLPKVRSDIKFETVVAHVLHRSHEVQALPCPCSAAAK